MQRCTFSELQRLNRNMETNADHRELLLGTSSFRSASDRKSNYFQIWVLSGCLLLISCLLINSFTHKYDFKRKPLNVSKMLFPTACGL